jgi:hypothetical protein
MDLKEVRFSTEWSRKFCIIKKAQEQILYYAQQTISGDRSENRIGIQK